MTTEDSAPNGFTELAELWDADEGVSDTPSGVDPVRRRRRRRARGIGVAAFFAAVLAAIGIYVGWALTAPVRAPELTIDAPDVPSVAPAAVALPAAGASAISVSGADDFLGASASGIWLSSGTDEPRSIASISKLITALVVLDAVPLAAAGDPGPTITFSEADHDLYDQYYVRGATIAAMPAGTSMSLHDALATMLIPSASNYADAVSTWAFGTRGRFVDAAAGWLSAHGLTGTTIVEPTGVDPRNTSTPSDLIAIGRLAAVNPVISAIAATPSLTLPGPGAMYNTNGLLGTDGVTGLKTGNLGEGTFSLLYTATLDVGSGTPLSIVGVKMDGFSRDSVNADVTRVLDSIRSGFHNVALIDAGHDLGGYTTPWGASARIVVSAPASIFTWSDTPITVSLQTVTPSDYRDGEVVGTLTWTAGPRTTTAEVRIDGEIEPPTQWWRLTHPAELGG